ncbi:hypothetical protein HpBGD24_09950 [Helicobacter pylori]
METKEEDKDKKLEEMIVSLCEKGDLSSQTDQIIKDLKEIYQGEYRHKYSKITTIILNSTRDREQAFMTLAQNIRTLKEIQDNKEVESIKPKLEKLYDHMNLECIRLQDFDEKMSRVKDVSIRLNDLNKNYKKLSEELNKQQTQYITILGIFASIVLTFVAGLTFFTSVLSNIDKANAYRLVFVMAFMVLFFGNILYLLFFFFIKNILIKREKR